MRKDQAAALDSLNAQLAQKEAQVGCVSVSFVGPCDSDAKWRAGGFGVHSSWLSHELS
jgi:hypothetical protein